MWLATATSNPTQKGIRWMRLSHARAAVSARFDDPNLVSCAGLVPVMVHGVLAVVSTQADQAGRGQNRSLRHTRESGGLDLALSFRAPGDGAGEPSDACLQQPAWRPVELSPRRPVIGG